MELFNVILTTVSILSVTAWMGYEFAKLQAFNKQKKEIVNNASSISCYSTANILKDIEKNNPFLENLASECDELVKSSYDFGEKSEVLKNLEHLQENEPPVMQKDAVVNSRNTCFTDTFKPQNCASNIVGKHKPKLNGGW